jgi:hypothetical protein
MLPPDPLDGGTNCQWLKVRRSQTIMSPLLNLRQTMHWIHGSVPVSTPLKSRLCRGWWFRYDTGRQTRAGEQGPETQKLYTIRRGRKGW